MNTTIRTLQRSAAVAALAIASAVALAAPGGDAGHGMGMGPGMGGPGMGMGMGMGMGPGMGMGMGPGMMAGGRHGDRLLESVGATAEQRSQIRAIMDAARNDLKAQHESARGLHEQARQIFTAPTVDARAAEALRQQMLAQHDQSSKRMLQAMLDASRVLTPEQRQALAQKMAERRAAMQHRHAERQGAPAK